MINAAPMTTAAVMRPTHLEISMGGTVAPRCPTHMKAPELVQGSVPSHPLVRVPRVRGRASAGPDQYADHQSPTTVTMR